MLIILLILVDQNLHCGFTLLLAYYFIFNLVHKYLNRIGEERVKIMRNVLRLLQRHLAHQRQNLEVWKIYLIYFQTLQKFLR